MSVIYICTFIVIQRYKRTSVFYTHICVFVGTSVQSLVIDTLRMILFYNSFYTFTFYLRKNFIIKFNKISYFPPFLSFFQYNLSCWSILSLVHIRYYSTFYDHCFRAVESSGVFNFAYIRLHWHRSHGFPHSIPIYEVKIVARHSVF